MSPPHENNLVNTPPNPVCTEKNENFYNTYDFQLETDFELLIPDFYENNIAERLSIYQAMDTLKKEEDLEQFKTNLKDRFGELPKETLELLETLKLKWIAKTIGLEKVVLKQQKMIGYFTSNQQSDYFESARFTRVLEFIQSNPRNCKMSEKNNKLRLIFSDVNSISEAIKN